MTFYFEVIDKDLHIENTESGVTNYHNLKPGDLIKAIVDHDYKKTLILVNSENNWQSIQPLTIVHHLPDEKNNPSKGKKYTIVSLKKLGLIKEVTSQIERDNKIDLIIK